jgi:phage gp46-like protein
MSADLALAYDPAAIRCDLRWGGRDLVLDTSPATPGLISLLCDRRARPDDPLPLPSAPLLEPDRLAPRRGWCGDALDRAGQRIGSRLWLLARAKETEATRRRAEAYAREALAWAVPQGLAVTAAWVRRGVLGLRCRIGRDEVEIQRPVS